MSKELRLQVVLSAIDRLRGPFEKAKTANSRLAKQLKSTRERLTQLNQASQKLSQLQTLSGKINTLGQGLGKKVRLKGKMMGLEMASLENPTKNKPPHWKSSGLAWKNLSVSIRAFSPKIKKSGRRLIKWGYPSITRTRATAHILQKKPEIYPGVRKSGRPSC